MLLKLYPSGAHEFLFHFDVAQALVFGVVFCMSLFVVFIVMEYNEIAALTFKNKLRGEVYAHQTSFTPSLFLNVPVPKQVSHRSCICVLMKWMLPLPTILIF
jgi:hypothetical protein